MNRHTSSLLVLTLFLGACSSTSTPSETSSTTEPADASRDAVIPELENDVSARTSDQEDFIPASNGMSIHSTGGIQTGDESRARIDLLPDGTIVRIGPNSSFVIPVLGEENGKPKTRLELLFGKVFILLKGGSLDVETPSGVASVRGSLLSVRYDPEKDWIEATCLEGHCALEDEEGDEVELEEGESSFIEGDNDPSEPELIDQEDIQDWLDENPDLLEYMDELPDPEDFPEDFDLIDGEIPDEGESQVEGILDLDPSMTDEPAAGEEILEEFVPEFP